MSESPGQSDSSASGDAAFSQDDIDALLNSESKSPDDEGATSEPASGAEADTSVSQDDIDAGISAADETSASPESTDGGSRDADAAPDERLDSMGRPFDAAAAAMQAAIEEDQSASDATAPPPPPPPPAGAQRPDLPSFDGPVAEIDPNRVTMLNDVKLRVKIELGRTRMLVEDVLKLGEGSVVELDKLAGDPVDVYINDRLVARGEVLVLNDNFCVRICDVISNDPHRISA